MRRLLVRSLRSDEHDELEIAVELQDVCSSCLPPHLHSVEWGVAEHGLSKA